MSNYKPLKLIIQYLLFIGILMNILFIPVYQNICFASDDNFEIVEIDWKGNQEEDDDKKVVFQVSIVHNVLFLGYSKLLFEIRSNILNIIHLEILNPA